MSGKPECGNLHAMLTIIQPGWYRRIARAPEPDSEKPGLDRVVERVAGRSLPLSKPRLNQSCAARRAVVEAFGNDIALGPLLQRVVADLLRRVERLFEIALFEDALSASVKLPQMPAKQSACSSTRIDIALASASLICCRIWLNLGRMPVRFWT